MKRVIVVISALLMVVAASAHPGHGPEGQPVLHYITSWWHAFPVVVALLFMIYLSINKKHVKT